MIKKILKALTKTILVLLLSAGFLLAVLQNSYVQSYLAQSGSAILSRQLGVPIWIEKIRISGFLNLSLNKVLVLDDHNETMVSAKKIFIDLPLIQGFSENIPINKIEIDSAYINIKKYKDSDELNITKSFSSSNDTLKSDNDTAGSAMIRFTLAHLLIRNSRFIYEDATTEKTDEFGMDYAGLDISNINLEMNDIAIFNDSIISQIIHVDAQDKCGIALKHLEGRANVSSKGTFLENGVLQTDRSRVSLDLGFNYDHWSAYLDFINEVDIQSEILNAQLNLDDIAFFAPEMQGMDDLIRFNGQVKGTVRNLKVKNLDLNYAESTSFRGDVQLTGLPDFYESFMKLKIKALSTDVADIRSFKLPNGARITNIPKEIEKFGKIRIKGRYTGFYNDFVSNADVYTELGKLNTNIQFKNNIKEGILYYDGDFRARDFDLGQFIDMEDDFGKINFDLMVDGKGLNISNVNAKVEGRIDSLEYKENPINTIYINALVNERKFEGNLHLIDNLLQADFSGLIDFDTIIPVFDFTTKLKEVKLSQLGLIDANPDASLSSQIQMNFTGSSIDDFEGVIFVDSTEFFYSDKYYGLDSLHIYSKRNSLGNQKDHIKIRSDYINGDIKGDYRFKTIASSIESLSQRYLNNIEFVQSDTSENLKENFDFQFHILNSNEFLPIFTDAVKLSDSISLSGLFNSHENNLQINTDIGEISYNELKAENLSFDVNTLSEQALSHLKVAHFIFKQADEVDTLELGIDSLLFNFKLANNKGLYDLNWNNESNFPKNRGHVSGDFRYFDYDKFEIGIDTLDAIINDSAWNSIASSSVKIDSSSIQFDSLQFYSSNQHILLNGVIAETMDQGFVAKFQNFNVAVFNLLTASSGISFGGNLSGDFQLIDAYRNPGILADLELQNFVLNGEALGYAEINSTLGADQSIFINLNLLKHGSKGDYKPLYMEGYYYPNDSKNQLDIDVSLHNLSLNFLNPFLNSFVSDLEGSATGEIVLKGSLKEPDLSGQLDLVRTQFRIKYLNTLYSLSGTLGLNNQILGFDNVSLYDTVGNIAYLSGGLSHERLRNFGVDLRVRPENFVSLNTRLGMNELFYGKAVVTGDLLIKGPFDNIFLDIDARSNRGTDLKIPINTTLGISENSFIVFVNDEDTSSYRKDRNFVPQLSNFSLNMDLSITPEAKIEISLPSQMGEIQATGFGDLNMNLSRTGNFRMSGDYRVADGSFFFRIRNLLNRKFELNEGGTISWTGDPYSGILGMSANYQLKTSLNSLGLDQDSSYRNRVPVDCIIGLSGPIMDPDVKFKFKFPNATEEVKQYVYTKIDTTNSSEMSQQMLSLLIFNSFSFNSGTGNTSLANNVSGSSMQIVANQLSNWLSQISKDVDIGINYRPGGDLTNEEVEVALSTQLWDERVSIDGNFGYQNIQDNPSANTSNIVGDINVEVKLTNDGRLRLKAFNRTNTVDLLDNTSPYTQGVGIFYRKEFNNFQELFTNQRKKGKEKRAAEHKKDKARVNEEEETKSSEEP